MGAFSYPRAVRVIRWVKFHLAGTGMGDYYPSGMYPLPSLIVADPGLSVRPCFLGMAGPQSFGPSLANILWAAWPAK